jgi:hypothetical protein
MTNYSLHEINLTEPELLWLQEVYESFKAGEKVDVKALKVKLRGRIPTEFEPKKIDDRLLRFGQLITLYGIWHVNRHTKLLDEADQVIRAIGKIISDDTKRETVTALEVSNQTGLATQRVEFLIREIRLFGFFWSELVSASEAGYSEVKVNNEEVFNTYYRYENIEKLLNTWSERRERDAVAYSSNLIDTSDKNLASNDATFLRANELYLKVKGLFENTNFLDKTAAKLIIELADDAIKEFGNTNQDKKVELRSIKEKAEEVLPPKTVKELRERAEGIALGRGYPKNKLIRNWIYAIIIILIIISSLIALKATFLDSGKKAKGGSASSTVMTTPIGTVDADVTLYEENREFPASQYPHGRITRPPATTLKYLYERVDDKLRIKYEMPYLTWLSDGSPIEPLTEYGRPELKFTWQYPKLAVKVVNNTNRTLLLSEATIEILASEINKEPVLIIQSAWPERPPLGTFHLVNEGWGDVVNATITYEARAENVNEFNFKKSKGVINVGTFSDEAEITIVPNIPFKYDCSHNSQYQLVDVSGVIKYETEYHEKRENKFKTKVVIGVCRELQGAMVESSEYDVMLEAGKANYTRNMPIAQEVKAGETDYFIFQLATNKSARFDLRLSLREAGGVRLPSKSILIDVFIPRYAVEFLPAIK